MLEDIVVPAEDLLGRESVTALDGSKDNDSFRVSSLQRSRVADTTIAKQSPPSSPVHPPLSAQPSPIVTHSGEAAIDEDDRHRAYETPLRYISGDVRPKNPRLRKAPIVIRGCE
nr:hypothetical protein Iba_chr01eCG7010 [Ipomoea batatas]